MGYTDDIQQSAQCRDCGDPVSAQIHFFVLSPIKHGRSSKFYSKIEMSKHL